jgi:histidinol phosphatase-like PHP family hydrolase
MHERNIRVVIGADAHSPSRVGANFDQARLLLSEAGYTVSTLFLERTPLDLPLTAVPAAIAE